MKASEFCYWLQGYFEIHEQNGNPEKPALSANQVDVIKAHLAMVFIHDIDPKQGSPEHQAKLQTVHDAGKPKIGGVGPNGELYRC